MESIKGLVNGKKIVEIKIPPSLWSIEMAEVFSFYKGDILKYNYATATPKYSCQHSFKSKPNLVVVVIVSVAMRSLKNTKLYNLFLF